MKHFTTHWAYAFLLAVFSGGTVQAQYQLANPGFEGTWTDNVRKKYSENTPAGWNSFFTANTNTLTNLAFNMANQVGPLTKETDAHSGAYSAKIVSRKNMIGSISNGNLTTGRINMGNTDAANVTNYNYSDVTNPAYSFAFTGSPDSVSVWVKFIPVTVTDKASLHFIVHKKFNYKDPHETDENVAAYRVAYAKNGEIAKTLDGENVVWKRVSVPFSYNTENLNSTENYLLASFSTNANPGKGTANDALYVDDVEMIYNSRLAKIMIDEYEASVEEGETSFTMNTPYYEGIYIGGISDGVGAKVVNKGYDPNTKTVTLRVEGNNISEDPTNYHDYVISFTGMKEETSTPAVPASQLAGGYSGTLAVKFGGTTIASQLVAVTEAPNNKINLKIDNFSFNGMPIGDIMLQSVPLSADGASTVISGITRYTMLEGLGNAVLPVTVTSASLSGKEMSLSLSILGGMVLVDFYPYTVADNGDSKKDELAVAGSVSKEGVSDLVSAFGESSVNSLDLSETTLGTDVTWEDLTKNGDGKSVLGENALVYLPSGISSDLASQVVDKNAIVGGVAAEIVLADNKALNVSKPFTAKKINYTRTPSVYADGTNGWETITLPFDCSTFVASVKGNIVPVTTGQDGDFWLRSMTDATANSLSFESGTVAKMEANKPYIIAFPGSKFGEENSLEGQTITFIADEAVVQLTEGAKEEAGIMAFNGSYSANSTTGWFLNGDGNAFEYADAQSTVPFRPYLVTIDKTNTANVNPFLLIGGGTEITGTLNPVTDADRSDLNIRIADGGVEINALSAQSVTVYTLNGQFVQLLNLNEGMNKISLPVGMYLIGTQKVIVK